MFEKYTLDSQKILTMAESIAFSENSKDVRGIHLLLSFLKTDNTEVQKVFLKYDIGDEDVEELLKDSNKDNDFSAPIYMEYSAELKKILDRGIKIKEQNHDSLVSSYHLGYALLDSLDKSLIIKLGLPNKDTLLSEYKKFYRRSCALDKISDLHRLGEKTLDPLVGREDVLDELIMILKRRNKPNPILVGEPGVGKSFIVEHLARKIALGEIKELEDKTIFELDLPSAVSGTKYRGEFEEKIKKVIEKVIEDGHAILFVDEIHNIVKAGGAEGAIDCSNIIKPYLSRGEIQIIGATTYDEYEKVFSTDKALKRRFQMINVRENTVEETKDILKTLAPLYGTYYKKEIPLNLISTIVNYALVHLPNLSFPDKAIDILDNSLSLSKDKILSLSDIKKTMSLIYHIDVDNKYKIDETILNLKSKIVGQDKVLDQIKKDLKLIHYSFNKSRPKSILFFVGPSGVGKSYLAKCLAKILNDDDNHFLKIDMSSFKDPASISNILGSSKGYVGYNDESILAKQISKFPASLILLDEIEKAHPTVLDIFLSIFEEGYFITTSGKKIDCTNTIFILTGNIGFDNENDFHERINQKIISRKDIEKKIHQRFKYEFLARIDDIIIFNPLTLSSAIDIEKSYLKENNYLFEISEEHFSLEDKEAIKKYGARAIFKHAKNLLLDKVDLNKTYQD